MAFFGKEYKFVRDEKYEGFVRSWAVSEEQIKAHLNIPLTQKLTVNGDTYTLTFTGPNLYKELSFKSDVEFEEQVGLASCKTTINVEDFIVTQKQRFQDGKEFMYLMEFVGDDLFIAITNSAWNQIARLYYKA